MLGLCALTKVLLGVKLCRDPTTQLTRLPEARSCVCRHGLRAPWEGGVVEIEIDCHVAIAESKVCVAEEGNSQAYG